MSNRSLCGLDITLPADLNESYENALNMGYSFISTYMFHPTMKRDYIYERTKDRKGPATRSDFVLQEGHGGKSFSNALVGRISPWIDVDSTCVYTRRNSEKAFLAELNWASHLGLPVVVVKLQRRSNPNLARILASFFEKEHSPFKVWIQIPLMNPSVALEESVANALSGGEQSTAVNGGAIGDADRGDDDNKQAGKPCDWRWEDDTWLWWSELASLSADWSSCLGVFLELCADQPPQACIDRWFAEPVVGLALPTSLFLTNRKDYPVLSQSHQTFIKRFFKLNVQLVISGACRHKRGYGTYQQYMSWVYKNQGALDVYNEHSKGLEDYLQEPLQPLADNLCSATYSVFELDPYKYKAYENAVYEALLDRVPAGSPDSPPPTTVIMVLGAGRGPLVACALRAAGRAERPVRVYAVEKNPNALVTLQNRLHDDWRHQDVHVLPGDMRASTLPELADIFVSELLGSFGDNELSPECLDGAQKYLKPDGLSIPSSYTSYLAPLQSMKIYKEVTRQKDPNKPEYVSFETPYVVRLLNCNVLAEPQAAFTFEHPKKDLSDDNSRHVNLIFEIKHDAVLHGFAGYFDSVLYKDIHMSIHPSRHSPDMFSWFPVVFPLDRPAALRAGDKVGIHMWRVVTQKQVWYEWALSQPITSRIHNCGGRSSTIGL